MAPDTEPVGLRSWGQLGCDLIAGLANERQLPLDSLLQIGTRGWVTGPLKQVAVACDAAARDADLREGACSDFVAHVALPGGRWVAADVFNIRVISHAINQSIVKNCRLQRGKITAQLHSAHCKC